jgi:hypothetical protein
MPPSIVVEARGVVVVVVSRAARISVILRSDRRPASRQRESVDRVFVIVLSVIRFVRRVSFN